MKNTLQIILLLFGLFISCEKSEPILISATPELLLAASNVKKWELIDPTVQLVVGSKVPVIKPPAPPGQVSNGLGYFYFLFLNKTINFQDGYGTTVNDKTVEKGTWDFANGEKTAIKVTLGARIETWNIKTLTPSRLIVEVNGTTLTYAPTPGTP